MSRPVSSFPSADEGQCLHDRLRGHDAQATAAVCQRFLPFLECYLARQFPDADDHLCKQAAETALIDYLKAPDRFDPQRCNLGGYLCMAARRDLANLLAREARHRAGRASFFVEIGKEGGNLVCREEAPLDLLVRAEEAATHQELLRAIEADCDDWERRVFRLMRVGVHDTASCAAALGIGELAPSEQAVVVKRIKDRLKKRLGRRRSA